MLIQHFYKLALEVLVAVPSSARHGLVRSQLRQHVDLLLEALLHGLDRLDELLALQGLQRLNDLLLGEVGLDANLSDPNPLVAGILYDLVDQTLLPLKSFGLTMKTKTKTEGEMKTRIDDSETCSTAPNLITIIVFKWSVSHIHSTILAAYTHIVKVLLNERSTS